MKSIDHEAAFAAVRARLLALTPDHPRQWGHMQITDMLVHCRKQLQLALGEISSPAEGAAFLRTSFGRWVALSSIPWPKGSTTPTQMNVLALGEASIAFNEEKESLLQYLDRVRTQERLSPHPFFGELSRKQWGRLIYKHLDHHLSQFAA